MARPRPSRCALSKKIVSPIAIASTMDTASSARLPIDSVSTESRPPATSIHAMTIAAVSVVRAALIVKVPIPGASALTIRLVTDHDSADPSAQSTPIVSFIGSLDPPRGRRHHLRIRAKHERSDETIRAQGGAGESLAQDARRAPAAGHTGRRPPLRSRLQGAAGEEESLAGRGASGGEWVAENRGGVSDTPRRPRLKLWGVAPNAQKLQLFR